MKKKEAERLANGMLIRNTALEQEGFLVDQDELITPVQDQAPAAEITKSQDGTKWMEIWNYENDQCASVGTPSSSYPSRSPSPERLSLEALRRREATRKLQATQELDRHIEALRAQRMVDELQHAKASNVARARRARAIFERNIKK